MRKLIVVALVTLFVANSALAASCEERALDKNGKPLKGAVKNNFMKKCESDEALAACETKALDKNGKALAGAAKNAFMKKCEADAAKK